MQPAQPQQPNNEELAIKKVKVTPERPTKGETDRDKENNQE